MLLRGLVDLVIFEVRGPNQSIAILLAPGPLYDTAHYNMVLDTGGPQMIILHYFLLHVSTFYYCYNKDWIANTEISLDPNNSVIKRLWCNCFYSFLYMSGP